MRCPACGHKELIEEIRDETLSTGQRPMTLHEMKGSFCPRCGDGVWDAESYRRYTEAMEAQARATRTGACTDIKRIRNQFNLTQKCLAESVGLGKTAVSRYERGVSTPSAPW